MSVFSIFFSLCLLTFLFIIELIETIFIIFCDFDLRQYFDIIFMLLFSLRL